MSAFSPSERRVNGVNSFPWRAAVRATFHAAGRRRFLAIAWSFHRHARDRDLRLLHLETGRSQHCVSRASVAAAGRQPRFPMAADSRRWKAGPLLRTAAYGRRRELTLSANSGRLPLLEPTTGTTGAGGSADIGRCREHRTAVPDAVIQEAAVPARRAHQRRRNPRWENSEAGEDTGVDRGAWTVRPSTRRQPRSRAPSRRRPPRPASRAGREPPRRRPALARAPYSRCRRRRA